MESEERVTGNVAPNTNGKCQCVTQCFHGGRLYQVGDIETFGPGNPPPLSGDGKTVRHFVPVGGETGEHGEQGTVAPAAGSGGRGRKKAPKPAETPQAGTPSGPDDGDDDDEDDGPPLDADDQPGGV